MHKFFVAGVVVISLLITAGVMAESRAVLVLTDGTSLDISKASVEGKLVYVAFESGQMQAYPIEEVDLQASGLVPEAAVKEVRRKNVPTIADARSPDTGRTGTTITDGDVSHVKPSEQTPEIEETKEGETAPPVALAISDTKQQIAGNVINYSGMVLNVGTETVGMITVKVSAVNDKGVSIGEGSTTITREVVSGNSVAFAVSFPFEGRIAEIITGARATLANFSFAEKKADS